MRRGRWLSGVILDPIGRVRVSVVLFNPRFEEFWWDSREMVWGFGMGRWKGIKGVNLGSIGVPSPAETISGRRFRRG